MPEIKIKVWADLSKEYLFEKAIEKGLSEKAADYFKFFNEVELDLTVDSKTGEVLKTEIPNKEG